MKVQAPLLVVRSRRRGFTLIEVLIVIGVIAILVAMITVAISVVRKNIAGRATRVALENAMGLQQEYESAKGLSVAMKSKAVNGSAANPYGLTVGLMASARAVPKNSESISKMPMNTISDITSMADAWATSVAYGSGQSVVSGSAAYRCIADHLSDASNAPGSAGGGSFWVSITSPVIAPNDGWGKPVLFVGSALTSVTTNESGTAMARSDVKSPNGRPFWVSAGPDGNFATHDDNVYSFEN